MSSAAQLAANAVNAFLSTGPQTAEGKARSSQNARKHGLTAQKLVIPAGDAEEFAKFAADLKAEIRPQGPLQQILFDELASAAWNLRRIRAMETDVLDDRLARHKTRIERTFHRSLRELKALQTDAALTRTLPAKFMQTVQPLASRSEIAKRTQSLARADRKYNTNTFWWATEAEADALEAATVMHDNSGEAVTTAA